MPERTVVSSANNRFCASCGTSVPAGHRFCENCGAPAPIVEPAQPVSAPQVQGGIPYADSVAGSVNPQVQQAFGSPGEPFARASNGPSGISIVSLVLGIVGILFSFAILGIIPGIVAIVLAIIARKKQKSSLAIAGLATGIVSVVISALMIVFLVVVVKSVDTLDDYDFDEFPSDYESINPVSQVGSNIIGSWDVIYAEKKGVPVIHEDNLDEYAGNFVLTLSEDGSFVLTTPDGDYTGTWYDYGDGSGSLMTDEGDGFYDISYDKSQLILEDAFNEEKLIFDKA